MSGDYDPAYYESRKEKAIAASRRWQKANPGKTREACRKHAETRTRLIAGIKLSRGCLDCGYKAHSEALEFDHVRGEKLFQISSDLRRPLDLVLAEIEKCDVVCANCHRVRTATRRKNRRE